MGKKDRWKMPEWMEKFRDAFQNTGGNSIEEFMNDRTTTMQNNYVRASLIIAVISQVALLERLHDQGIIH